MGGREGEEGKGGREVGREGGVEGEREDRVEDGNRQGGIIIFMHITQQYCSHLECNSPVVVSPSLAAIDLHTVLLHQQQVPHILLKV